MTWPWPPQTQIASRQQAQGFSGDAVGGASPLAATPTSAAAAPSLPSAASHAPSQLPPTRPLYMLGLWRAPTPHAGLGAAAAAGAAATASDTGGYAWAGRVRLAPCDLLFHAGGSRASGCYGGAREGAGYAWRLAAEHVITLAFKRDHGELWHRGAPAGSGCARLNRVDVPSLAAASAFSPQLLALDNRVRCDACGKHAAQATAAAAGGGGAADAAAAASDGALLSPSAALAACGRLTEHVSAPHLALPPEHAAVLLARMDYSARLGRVIKIRDHVDVPLTMSLPAPAPEALPALRAALARAVRGAGGGGGGDGGSGSGSGGRDAEQASLLRRALAQVEAQMQAQAQVHAGAASGTPASPTAYRYGLYAILMHAGESAGSGHYYSYCRRSEGAGVDLTIADCPSAPWRKLNDTRVDDMPWAAVAGEVGGSHYETPYLLFYRRLYEGQGQGEGEGEGEGDGKAAFGAAAALVPAHSQPPSLPLPNAWWLRVARDNERYASEQLRLLGAGSAVRKELAAAVAAVQAAAAAASPLAPV